MIGTQLIVDRESMLTQALVFLLTAEREAEKVELYLYNFSCSVSEAIPVFQYLRYGMHQATTTVIGMGNLSGGGSAMLLFGGHERAVFPGTQIEVTDDLIGFLYDQKQLSVLQKLQLEEKSGEKVCADEAIELGLADWIIQSRTQA